MVVEQDISSSIKEDSMYIQIGNTQYPCAGYDPLPGVRARYTGIDGLALPVAGTVTLYAGNGFVLAEQDAADYARQTYENGVLTLTNEPEPVPAPEPDPVVTEPTEIDQLRADVDYIAVMTGVAL